MSLKKSLVYCEGCSNKLCLVFTVSLANFYTCLRTVLRSPYSLSPDLDPGFLVNTVLYGLRIRIQVFVTRNLKHSVNVKNFKSFDKKKINIFF
jgi:hypothetical protein